MKRALAFALLAVGLASTASAQWCPEKNVMYWQAFPPGGESDLSARHQQVVLKKKCPNIDTIIQYKPGAGGGLMWAQMNQLPADGLNIVGVNLPHIVFQPLEGQVQYKTDDVVPVYWFHYTPDTLVVRQESPIKTFQEFIKAAKADPGKMNLGGSGLNSANHAAHERMNATFGVKTTYIPFKGTGDMQTAVFAGHVDGAMTYTAFAINNKQRVRALAVAMDRRHPLMPDVPTFKELGVDWVDGAYRGIGMPKSSTPEQRKRMSDLWATLNNDPEMKELAAKSGNLDEARQAYLESARIGQAAGDVHLTIVVNSNLANILVEQGSLHKAARLYHETLQMATRPGGRKTVIAGRVCVELSQVYYEWNQLDQAADYARESLALCRQWGNVDLQAAGFGVNRYTSSGLRVQDTGHRCPARPRARSIRRADTSLPECDFDIAIVENMNELDVGAIRKRRMFFQQRPDV